MATTTAMDSDNLSLTRRVFSWFACHDVDAIVGVLDPEITARPTITGAPDLRGREAVERWLREVTKPDELEIRPLDYEARGDCVIVRGYIRRRSGRTLAESQVFWLHEIRDGRIVRMQSFPTRSAALAAC